MQRAQPSKHQEAWQTGWDMGRINLLQLLHDALEAQHREQKNMENPKSIMKGSFGNSSSLLGALRN